MTITARTSPSSGPEFLATEPLVTELAPSGAVHEIYGIDRWGDGMFAVLANGDLGLLDPEHPGRAPVSLPRVIDDLAERGVSTPVVVRVASFLSSRIAALNTSFAAAIAEAGYTGSYRSVFPIKVNQQADVVDRIVEHGRPWDVGLEAGSKPELMIALSRALPPDAIVVCNGVKDAEFVNLAISAHRIGIDCVIVLESAGELDVVLRVAEELGQRPLLGVRIKLTEKSIGSWAASSGDRSSFGVTAPELMSIIDRLTEVDMLDCLVLQHSHVGSQVPNVNAVRRAVGEASRFFVELRRQGAPLDYLDLGGGLGVDYTGEHRSVENSIGYTLDEYCINVVDAVKYALDGAGETHPVLITESGRATVAHSSMLVFDVLDATEFDRAGDVHLEPDDHPMLVDLVGILDYVGETRLQESVSDADFFRAELRDIFRRGLLPIRQLARAEEAHLTVVNRVKEIAAAMSDVPVEVVEVLARHVDIYHGNFSVFQSLPDSWAISQIHPCVPIQRLDELPQRRAVVSDLTCDSDGKIDRFVTAAGVTDSLPIHDLEPGERYRLAVMLVGAYQETLGDLHNLFGDTHLVTIDLGENGEFELLHETEGDTVAEVLEYVEYDAKACLDAFKTKVDAASSLGRIDTAERRDLIATYRHGLTGYTYFEY